MTQPELCVHVHKKWVKRVSCEGPGMWSRQSSGLHEPSIDAGYWSSWNIPPAMFQYDGIVHPRNSHKDNAPQLGTIEQVLVNS